MSKWTLAKRRKAGRKAWRTRKAKGAKGTCPVCHKKVWARGKKYKGRWYHATCLIALKHPERLV